VFQNGERYRFLKSLAAGGQVQDPLLARQLDVLVRDFESNQMTDHQLRRLVALRVAVESLYNNFRATLGGQRVSDNRLREVLRSSTSTAEVREAWEAWKQIGTQ